MLAKRIFDLMLATIGGILVFPIVILIALMIKVDSPGPIIFAQTRLGLGGKPFTIYKFRKFPHGTGSRGANVTVANDARMTRLGRFLERSKLDELPQLWNILKGDMSFVGPRPEIMRFADAFTDDLKQVHDFLPGIFGPNQIAFRNEALLYPPECDPEAFYRESLLPQKARTDIDYFKNASLSSDIGWIIKGIWASLIGAIAWRAYARSLLPPVSLDAVLVLIAWAFANIVRFEGLPAGPHWAVFVTGMWLMPLIVIFALLAGGVYRAPLRHFGFSEVLRLSYANLAGWLAAFVVMMAFLHRTLSLSVIPVSLLACITLMSLPRIFARRRYYRRRGRGDASHGLVADVVPVMIYGADRRGAALATLLRDGFDRVHLVGLLDDDEERCRGKRIAGLPVLGSERDLDSIHARYRFKEIWLTFNPNNIKASRLNYWCEKNDVRMVVLPAMESFQRLIK